MSQLNANSILFEVFSVTSPGTAEQLTSYQIPDGLPVVLMNRRSNSGNFYIGDTKANAEGTQRKVLIPGQSIIANELRIDNTNRLWADADSSDDVLEYTIQRIPSTGG